MDYNSIIQERKNLYKLWKLGGFDNADLAKQIDILDYRIEFYLKQG